jgi:hypothetical protein
MCWSPATPTHLPLYRQAGILARQGILVDRATLASWVGTGAAEIVPVVRRMKAILLGSARLFADDTSVPVLDPGRGQDEDRLVLDHRARRPALGRRRSTGGRLHLRPGPRP